MAAITISAVCEDAPWPPEHLVQLVEGGFHRSDRCTGGARSGRGQMLATTLGKSVATVEAIETGTLGAAITGAVGVGFADYPAAAKEMVGGRNKFKPTLTTSAWSKIRNVQQAVETLTPLWHSFLTRLFRIRTFGIVIWHKSVNGSGRSAALQAQMSCCGRSKRQFVYTVVMFSHGFGSLNINVSSEYGKHY